MPMARSRSTLSEYSAHAVATHSPAQWLPANPPRLRLGRELAAEDAAALVGVEAPTQPPWPRFARCSKRPLPRSKLALLAPDGASRCPARHAIRPKDMGSCRRRE